jgi:hypothetical protein
MSVAHPPLTPGPAPLVLGLRRPARSPGDSRGSRRRHRCRRRCGRSHGVGQATSDAPRSVPPRGRPRGELSAAVDADRCPAQGKDAPGPTSAAPGWSAGAEAASPCDGHRTAAAARLHRAVVPETSSAPHSVQVPSRRRRRDRQSSLTGRNRASALREGRDVASVVGRHASLPAPGQGPAVPQPPYGESEIRALSRSLRTIGSVSRYSINAVLFRSARGAFRWHAGALLLP